MNHFVKYRVDFLRRNPPEMLAEMAILDNADERILIASSNVENLKFICDILNKASFFGLLDTSDKEFAHGADDAFGAYEEALEFLQECKKQYEKVGL